MREYEDITVVDKNDNVVASMQLPDALREGKRVRVVRIFIINDKDQLLLQKRSEKVIAPGLWGESSSGHVDYGESYELSAQRELQEELGVEAELKEVDYFLFEENFGGFVTRRFQKIYIAKNNGPFKIDREEVAETKWFDIDQLQVEIGANPKKYTNGFKNAFERLHTSGKLG